MPHRNAIIHACLPARFAKRARQGYTRRGNGSTWNLLLSVLSGVLLALAFPKFNLYWLAWIALAPFFVALRRSESWKESLLCGLLFGVFFFGVHLFWVNTLFRFAGWWAAAGWAAFVLFETMFVLLFVFILKVGLTVSAGRQGVWPARETVYAIFLAVSWTLIEWLRAQGSFGATVGDIGYSQVELLPLIQIASFASVYGVSFLVVLVNAAVVSKRRNFIIAVLALVVLVYGYGFFELKKGAPVPADTIKLALIQPNIDQKDKLDPGQVRSTFDLQEGMSRQASRVDPDIIIWPETAVFSYLLRNPALLPRLKQLAIDTGAGLVFGTPYYSGGGKSYNSIVSISNKGEVVSRYDKQRLVPFGEYLPFRKLLYPMLAGVGYYDQEFSSNPAAKPILAGGAQIAAVVCFESTFPGLIGNRVKEGYDFILTVTNDAWFNDSSAPYFHLNTGIFRAIENRRYFVQVGNTGLTFVIDRFGRVLKKTNLNQREILTFEIPLS